MIIRSIHKSVAFAIAAALASASATAADATSDGQASAWNFPNVVITKADSPAIETPATASAGMRAFKDKETGRLRNPTAEEMSEMAIGDAAAAPAAVSVRTLKNGMTTATLDESFMSYSVATKSSTGHVHADCAADAHEAAAAIHAVPAQEVSNDR